MANDDEEGYLFWSLNSTLTHPSEDEWQSLLSLMSEPEKARIARFIFRKDAKLALYGRLLIHHACARVLRLAPRAQLLDRTTDGKPFLLNPGAGALSPACAARLRHWNFNVSHDGDWVVLAAHPGLLVGIDVVQSALRPPHPTVDDFFCGMKSVLSSSEWSLVLAGDTPSAQLDRFFVFWALKEAYIKAIGIGLGIEPHELVFQPRQPERMAHFPRLAPPMVESSEEEPSPNSGIAVSGEANEAPLEWVVFLRFFPQAGWRFQVFRLDASHLVAIAMGPVGDATPSFAKVLPAALLRLQNFLPPVEFPPVQYQSIHKQVFVSDLLF